MAGGLVMQRRKAAAMRTGGKLLHALVLLYAATLLMPAQAFPVQIEDDQGNNIRLEQTAKRIIPLYGAFAEMLFAIGAGSYVVARTQADQFPEAIKALPSVGTHMRPNVEMIIGLKPDLVIQSVSRREALADMESLNRAGIPVVVFAPKSLSGIFSTMIKLGHLTGKEQEAESAVTRLKERLLNVQSRLGLDSIMADHGGSQNEKAAQCRIKERQRVFFEVRSEPLTAAGRGSIVQDILAAAGAENVVESKKTLLLHSLEALLFDNPDIYIVQTGPMNRNPVDPRERVHFDQLEAIRDGKILYLDEFLYSRPGPRCVDAVEQLAAKLYPECFRSNQ